MIFLWPYTATTALSNAYFGYGTGSIVLDEVACTGNESELFRCPHNGLGSHDCWHFEDAGVVCTGMGSCTFYTLIIEYHLFTD